MRPGMQETVRGQHGRKVAVALAVLVGAAGLVSAVSVSVTTLEALFGEVVVLGDRLEVSASEVRVVGEDAAATGTSASDAAEMTGDDTGARTANEAVTRGHWEYWLEVSETSRDAVGDDSRPVFRADLYLDGAQRGSLYFQQGSADNGIERAELRFDLGADYPAGDQSFRLEVVEV